MCDFWSGPLKAIGCNLDRPECSQLYDTHPEWANRGFFSLKMSRSRSGHIKVTMPKNYTKVMQHMLYILFYVFRGGKVFCPYGQGRGQNVHSDEVPGGKMTVRIITMPFLWNQVIILRYTVCQNQIRCILHHVIIITSVGMYEHLHFF